MYGYTHTHPTHCVTISLQFRLLIDPQANKLEESLSKYFGPSQPIAEDGEYVVSTGVM